MPPTLTAENATVTTASVTIKTLTIGGKQVTLAVFRQLIEEHIVDWEHLKFKGHGWGHVRYLVEGASDTVIHLVWQKGTELRRCRVLSEIPLYFPHPHEEHRVVDIYDPCTIENKHWRSALPAGRLQRYLENWGHYRDELSVLLPKYKRLVRPLFDLPQLFIAV